MQLLLIRRPLLMLVVGSWFRWRSVVTAVVVLLMLLLIVLVARSVAVHLSLMLQLADVGAHFFHFLHAFHVALKVGVLDFLVPKSLLPR